MRPLVFALLLIAGPVWAECDLKREEAPEVMAQLYAAIEFCNLREDQNISISAISTADIKSCGIPANSFNPPSAKVSEYTRAFEEKTARKLFGRKVGTDEAKKTRLCAIFRKSAVDATEKAHKTLDAEFAESQARQTSYVEQLAKKYQVSTQAVENCSPIYHHLDQASTLFQSAYNGRISLESARISAEELAYTTAETLEMVDSPLTLIDVFSINNGVEKSTFDDDPNAYQTFEDGVMLACAKSTEIEIRRLHRTRTPHDYSKDR